MQRRSFLKKSTTAVLAASGLQPGWLHAFTAEDWIDLGRVSIVLSGAAAAREATAARVLAEESRKRCGLDWSIGSKAEGGAVTIYAGTRAASGKLGQPVAGLAAANHPLPAEGFALQTGSDANGRWIAVFGADERGLLFGIGKLLRSIVFSRQAAKVDANLLKGSSSPHYPVRGHQLGYRPKTNSYDGWSVDMWDQYIRDLAVFGTNVIELMPPRTDDLPDSPHFPLPPARMMVEMSRIADSYGLDVSVWYPAMDKDYSDPHTVEAAIQEWGDVLKTLPRVDAIFVPGGDPGDTEPKLLMALLEKQKKNINRFHPKAQMWVSPQGFNEAWMNVFLDILKDPHTETWLDGVAFGPQSRLSPEEFRRAVPRHYPIRLYPDITHSVSCQYPVPDWDIAYALTEGREIINPRPESEADIIHAALPQTSGFVSYSEGCNDDVNKFVWSGLGWNPDQAPVSVLREFSRYFIGARYEDGFAEGLMNLERNWRGSLATNSHVDITLSGFQDMEGYATPAVLQNWRWQQANYRANYDAYVRARLLAETGQLTRSRDLLRRVWQVGWSPLPLGIGDLPVSHPSNALDPKDLLDAADAVLRESAIQPAAQDLRARVTELGCALFQSIHMQLSVEDYQGEAVERGANLDTLDTPLTDGPWLRAQIAAIRALPTPGKQVRAIRELLARTDPGPGGFYDELGNIANRPHFLPGPGARKDPDFRHSPLIEFSYPDHWGAQAPIAWKRWAGALYDAPIELRYEGLNPQTAYKVRVVYAGSSPRIKMRLQANDRIEIHPYITRSWPPAPQEFTIPQEATSQGALKLSWAREAGLGGNGRGCQVAEVWLMPVAKTEQK
jgi:hypothetical protein